VNHKCEMLTSEEVWKVYIRITSKSTVN